MAARGVWAGRGGGGMQVGRCPARQRLHRPHCIPPFITDLFSTLAPFRLRLFREYRPLCASLNSFCVRQSVIIKILFIAHVVSPL